MGQLFEMFQAGTVHMRSIATGEEVRTIPHSRLEFYPEACVVLSPDDKLLLVSRFPNLHLCDVASGAILATVPEEEDVRSIAWSPDGQHVAAGHGNGRITVWDLGSFAAAGAKKQR